MYKKLFQIAGLVCLLSHPETVSAQTEVLDQSAEPGNPTIGLAFPVLLSQAVTPGIGGRLAEVSFVMVEVDQLNFPYDYATTYLTILDTDPDGRPLSKVIARSEVMGRDVRFRFDETPVYLDAGRKYAFHLELDHLLSGQLHLATALQDYPGGDLWLFDHTQTWKTISGVSSNGVPMDLAFQTRMIPGLPAVRLVHPQADLWTKIGETLQIEASLAPGADPGATVEFFANGVSISNPVEAPYQIAWEPQEPGAVLLTAVLSSGGETMESAAVHHTVLSPTISNDDFEDAELITGAEVEKQWYNGNATRQPEEVFFADNLGGRSVWYRWVAPTTGTYTMFGRGLDAADQAFQLVMNVFIGESIDTMRFVAGSGDSRRETVWFEAEAGQEYRILVDGYLGETGFCDWSLGVRPMNDAFETREFLPRSGAANVGDNSGATIEPGEPTVHTGELHRTVWFSWRSPVDADVTLRVRSSEFEPFIRVFRGLELTKVEPVPVVSLAEGPEYFEVTFAANNAEAYALQIGSRDDRSGVFEIETTFHTTRFETPRRGQLIELGMPLNLKLDTSLVEESIDRIDVVANGEILAKLVEPPFEHSSEPSDVGAIVMNTRTHLSDGGVIESDDLEILIYRPGEFPQPRLLGGPFSIQSYVIQASDVSMRWGGLPPETTSNPADLALHPDWTLVDSGTYIGYSYPRPFDPPVPANEIAQMGDAWVRWARRTYLLTTDGRLYEDGQEVAPPQIGNTWRKFHGTTFLSSDGRVYTRENSGMVELTVPNDGSGFHDYVEGFGITRNGTPGRVVRDTFGNDAWFPLELPEGSSEATAVYSTAYDYYLLTSDGSLFRWNMESSAQLEEVPAPDGAGSWDRLSCGFFHVLGITSDGNLYAWGRNWENQLGIGGHHGVEYQDDPLFVRFPDGVNAWLDISAGERHSVAIGDDCNVYTWGDNERWQLGIGPNPNQPRPRKVPSLTQVCGHFELGGGGSAERGVLTFETRKNLTYHVQYSVDGVEWISVVPPIIGTGETVTWQDPDVYGPGCPCDDLPVRMYRVANKPTDP